MMMQSQDLRLHARPARPRWPWRGWWYGRRDGRWDGPCVGPCGALRRALAGAGLAGLLLTACGSHPPRPVASLPWPATTPATPTTPAASADPDRDGPGAQPPPDLHQVPDAQPQWEPVRPGGPNKPYAVLGQAYTPLAGDPPLLERGLASWYGRKFHGRGTANGETYNMYAMTAAHRTMPLPSYARVRNPANGREVVVRVNDRGPFHSQRVIDLSYTAALRLGVLGGVAPVEIERITYEAIRTGAWRAPASPGEAGAAPLAVATTTLLLPETAGWLADDAIAEIGRRTADRTPDRTADRTTDRTTDRTPDRTTDRTPDRKPDPLPPETTAPARAAAKAAPGFWLQLGAFAQRDGAVGFAQRVAQQAGWLAPLLAIFNERNLHRLQAGPYASRADASSAADRVREAISLVPAIVERR